MQFNPVKRRAFLTLIGSAAVWPLLLPVAAKARRVRRVGAMFWGAGKTLRKRQARVMAFRQGLEDLGWEAGRDLDIEFRWMRTDGDNDAQAAELLALAPDLIVTEGAAAISIFQRRTRTTPILFVRVPDPVGAGFVASLNRPGSNITGLTSDEPSIGSRWLGLLKEAAPGVNQVAVLADRFGPQGSATLGRMQALAPSFGVQLTARSVKNAAEIERAIDALARERDPGLIVLPSLETVVDHMQIVHLAAEYRVPAVYPHRKFVARGGAISYGIDTASLYRQAAFYADRILKGAGPANLPVQAPAKYELVINLKTARAGLTVPSTLLARADALIG
jgi:putative tryptophan/tyrosine transport system substrate-binding protein